ncbi:hypothetical protein [Actinomadura sp. 21ATH]
MARACQQAHGGPLAIGDLGLDHSAEEIAASAAALGGLPVRRSGAGEG